MKQFIYIFILFSFISCSQETEKEQEKEHEQEKKEMIVLEKADYSISYPADWLIKNDEPKAEIFICAPLEGVLDSFPDNFNLMKQNLLGKSIDLQIYDSISRAQIINAIGKDAIIEAKIENGHSYLLFKGIMDGRKLKWKQLYFVKNETAYILTFTAEEIYFDKYSDIAESIFNSFKLK